MAPKSGTATGPDLANFTVPEKILLAADELVRTSEQFSFTAESLIVASWRKYPQTFGLKGFAEQFPDSNKILASIMGEKGLAKEGRDAVKRLKSGEQAPPAPPRQVEEKPVPTRIIRSGFPLPIDAVLVRLLDGPVLSKQMEDRTADISFADACGFWDADPTQGAEAVKENLTAIKSHLDQADSLLAGGSLELSNGRSVDSADVSLLKTLNHYLQERFSRHINLIRNRVGKA